MSLKSKELIKTVVFCLFSFGSVLLRQFVFTPVVVRGHSMDPTLADGERVITLKTQKLIVSILLLSQRQMNQIKLY